jgi:tetratricopeptide (TPR) repeat protein
MARKSKLQELISQLNGEQLSEYLVEYSKKDKAFAKAFADFLNSKLMADYDFEIRQEVEDLFTLERPSGGRYSLYNDTDWYGIMHGVNDLFDKAHRALEKGLIHKAAGMALQWLSSFADNFTEGAFSYDDEGIAFGDACEEAGDIIDKAVNHPNADDDFKEDVADELSDIADHGDAMRDYCFYDIDSLSERINAMTETPERALATVEKMLNKGGYKSPVEQLIIQKYNLLMSMGRKDEALIFIKENISKEKVCDYIVDKYVKAKDYDMAIELLELAIKNGEDYNGWQWMRKEIEIYKKQKREEDVTKTYRRLFISCHGDIDCYHELKKRIPASEWKGYLTQLMSETPFLDPWSSNDDKAEILIAEGDFKALHDYLLSMKSGSYSQLEVLAAYANKLPEDLQPDVANFYGDVIRKEATNANKKDDYSRIRWNIERLRELHHTESLVSDIVAEFRNLYRRRPSFMRELDKIKMNG